MADSDRIRVSYAEETDWGVTPTTPTLKDLRLTAESLHQESAVITSAEIRSDRQVSAIKLVDVFAAGSLNIELSYAAYDDLLQAALFSAAWTNVATLSGTIYSAVASTNTYHTTGGNFVSGGLVLNQWIRVSGFTTAANNGYRKITAITADDITVSGGTLVDEAAGDTVEIEQGAYVINGSTQKSFVIEKHHTDLSNVYVLYNGMTIDTWSLAVNTAAILTGSFSFLGKTEISNAATVGGGYTTAPTNDVLSAVTDVTALLEGQAAMSARALTMQVANNLRARSQIGTLGPLNIAAGSINVTGTLQSYFQTHALMNKFLNQTYTSFAVVLVDQAGNAYVIDLPRVRFSSGQRVAGGQNTDIIADLAFSAVMHPTELKTIRIARFAA